MFVDLEALREKHEEELELADRRQAYLEDRLAATARELEASQRSRGEDKKVLAHFMKNFVPEDAEDYMVLPKSKYEQLSREAKDKVGGAAR